MHSGPPRHNASHIGFGVIISCLAVLNLGCGQSPVPVSKEAPPAVAPAGPVSDTRLSAFAQQIDTTTQKLTLKTGQTVQIPVTVRNPGPDTWISAGKAPVNFSYRWMVGSEDKVLVTPRTFLPQPLLPGQSVSLVANIVAPAVPGQYTLRLSMVQEGIEWFAKAGGQPKDIAVEVN